ncbi:MAG TPA: VWA domain-containing protein [Dehalococcoidia bacterium]|nr:VWA domain-containing protein [Dehalococcoidia bacterium]
MRRAIGLVAVASLFILRAAFAQGGGELTVVEWRQGAPPDDRVLTVIVQALDASGQPIPDASGFAAELDGTPVAIASERTIVDARIPLGVALTIDVSGSMAESGAIAQAKAAARSFVDQLGPQDSAKVIPFADAVDVGNPFTSDRAVLAAQIDGLVARGNTALYDAVRISSYVAAGSETARHAVVLLSDGRDFGGLSQSTREAALEAARASGVPFFVIGLGSDIDRPFLEELAAVTRGRFFPAETADLPAIYGYISALLRSQYELTIRLPDDLTNRAPALAVTLARDGSVLRDEVQLSLALPAPPPTAAPPPEPAPEERRGVSPILYGVGAVAGVAALLIAGRAAYLWRRRRRTAGPAGRIGPVDLPEQARGPVEVRRGRAVLTVTAGPDRGAHTVVEDVAVTLGSGRTCGLRLTEEQGLLDEHLRVWWRGEHLMAHSLDRARPAMVNGRAIDWAVLEDGDRLTLGGHEVLVRIERPAAPSPETAPPSELRR